MHKITPFLWFDNQAEEAMNFYLSVFENAEILNVHRNGKQLVMATFRLHDQEFMVLNAGPLFTFTEAVSFFVDCADQAEVDRLWETLSAGGEKGQCGWLKDKFGLSWQIVPKALGELLGDKDAEKAARVMQAMLQMSKIDVEALRKAYDQP